MSIETDGNGRLPLSKRLREKYGEKYHIVEHETKLELVPVSEDSSAVACEAEGDQR